MTSDVCPFSLDAIAYLKRNDFTEIVQLSDWLIMAKDGTRLVYIWLGGLLLPAGLPIRAQGVGARLDILSPNRDGYLRHLMNVLEES